MTNIIVTVKHAHDARLFDVQLAADVEAQRLAASLARRLHFDKDASGRLITYELEVHPPGRRLLPTETLAEVSAWDGSWIILHPHSIGQPQVRAPDLTKAGYTMKRLDAEAPSAPVPPPAAPQPTPPTNGGFVWKRLDEDTP